VAILARMPLLWRVFLINAALMAAAVVLLVATPATISSPAAASQILLLCMGLVVMLGLDLVLLRPFIAPLEQLAGTMAQVDLLQPGARVRGADGTAEVKVVMRAFNRMLDRLESERELSARRAVMAQEAERVRVSRELHDGVGQRLTAVLLRLQDVEARADGPVRDDLAGVRDEVRRSLEEVRDTARRLRPEALAELGLTAALVALTRDVARAAPFTVEREFDGELDDLGDELEIAAYRVVQEALSNALRHSGAARVTVRVQRMAVDDTLRVRISDDGAGFDPDAVRPGSGLVGMRERALLVGGRLAIEARPGAGTTIALTAPAAS
jgi:two-component system, NarL family, sensor histidine kinase UhpB